MRGSENPLHFEQGCHILTKTCIPQGVALKKIIIAHDLHALLAQDKTFLNRQDMRVLSAAATDEMLATHRAERANLLIMDLDMPGIPAEQVCALIRDDADLQIVSMIMVCADTPEAIGRSGRCRANAVLLRPVHSLVLMTKAQQLLDIAVRETLRVLLRVNIETRPGNEPFYCCSRDVSATGMRIETEEPLAQDARLSCIFYLPNTKKIQVTGKIVREIDRTPGDDVYQYGLMFMDIAPVDQKELIDYINSTLQGSHG